MQILLRCRWTFRTLRTLLFLQPWQACSSWCAFSVEEHSIERFVVSFTSCVFLLFYLCFIIRLFFAWWYRGRKRGSVEGDAGGELQESECLFSHDAAKLAGKCHFCGEACFSRLGLLLAKSDPIKWLSFSFCLSLQWTCHLSLAITVYFLRWFGMETEAIHWTPT